MRSFLTSIQEAAYPLLSGGIYHVSDHKRRSTVRNRRISGDGGMHSGAESAGVRDRRAAGRRGAGIGAADVYGREELRLCDSGAGGERESGSGGSKEGRHRAGACDSVRDLSDVRCDHAVVRYGNEVLHRGDLVLRRGTERARRAWNDIGCDPRGQDGDFRAGSEHW